MSNNHSIRVADIAVMYMTGRYRLTIKTLCDMVRAKAYVELPPELLGGPANVAIYSYPDARYLLLNLRHFADGAREVRDIGGTGTMLPIVPLRGVLPDVLEQARLLAKPWESLYPPKERVGSEPAGHWSLRILGPFSTTLATAELVEPPFPLDRASEQAYSRVGLWHLLRRLTKEPAVQRQLDSMLETSGSVWTDVRDVELVFGGLFTSQAAQFHQTLAYSQVMDAATVPRATSLLADAQDSGVHAEWRLAHHRERIAALSKLHPPASLFNWLVHLKGQSRWEAPYEFAMAPAEVDALGGPEAVLSASRIEGLLHSAVEDAAWLHALNTRLQALGHSLDDVANLGLRVETAISSILWLNGDPSYALPIGAKGKSWRHASHGVRAVDSAEQPCPAAADSAEQADTGYAEVNAVC